MTSKPRAPPQELVLTYFDIPGPAEAIRLAFYIGGVPFQDKRVSREEFVRIRAELPFQQLPILEADGVRIPQSAAILRFAGKLGGLYPTDLIDAAQCDAVMEGMMDIQAAIRPSIYEQDPVKKKQLRHQLSETTLPKWLGFLEGLLEKGRTPYFVGQSITICDLVIFTRMKWLCNGVLDFISRSLLDECPLLREHSALVAAHPKIVEYYSPHADRVLEEEEEEV